MSASNDALEKAAAEYQIPSPSQGYAMEFEPDVDNDYIPSFQSWVNHSPSQTSHDKKQSIRMN